MYPGQFKSCDGVITQSDHDVKLFLSTLYFPYMDVLTAVTLKTKSESINRSFEQHKNNSSIIFSWDNRASMEKHNNGAVLQPFSNKILF